MRDNCSCSLPRKRETRMVVSQEICRWNFGTEKEKSIFMYAIINLLLGNIGIILQQTYFSPVKRGPITAENIWSGKISEQC